MSATIKAQTASITAKLSALARAKAMPYDRLLTIFFIERAATRLVADPYLAEHLIFKGGYVNVRVYESPRYTRDLDATIRGADPTLTIKKIKTAMTVEANDGVWFYLAETSNLVAQGQIGATRLTYRAGLGEMPKNLEKAQLVDIDLGPGDSIIPSPRTLETPFLLGNGSLSWQVYSAETIVAEKLHALIARGAANSRSKDVFDLDLLLADTDKSKLLAAINATFAARSSALPAQISETLVNQDRALIRKGWQSAAGYIKSARDFDSTLDAVIECLRKLGL